MSWMGAVLVGPNDELMDGYALFDVVVGVVDVGVRLGVVEDV